MLFGRRGCRARSAKQSSFCRAETYLTCHSAARCARSFPSGQACNTPAFNPETWDGALQGLVKLEQITSVSPQALDGMPETAKRQLPIIMTPWIRLMAAVLTRAEWQQAVATIQQRRIEQTPVFSLSWSAPVGHRTSGQNSRRYFLSMDFQQFVPVAADPVVIHRWVGALAK